MNQHRVAFFHPTFSGFGGAEVLLASQAQYLKRTGHDVCVVTLSWDPERWQGPLDGIELRFTAAEHLRDKLLDLLPGGNLRRRGERACLKVRDRDVVVAMNFPSHAQLGASDYEGTKVWYCNEPSREHHPIETNPRLFAHVQGREPQTDLERYFAQKMRRFSLATRFPGRLQRERRFDLSNTPRLDRIIAISEFTRDNAARIYGVRASHVVPAIVRFPDRGRARSGIDRARPGILTHSRLEQVKNVEIVIRSFAVLTKNHPGATLHVVGEGAARHSYELLARDLGVAGSIHFHGFLSKSALSAVYDACDIFALLPLDEPFGMVFPEAAARGLLIVGPDHGGPLEILDGGKLGFVSDPFSIQSVVDSLERVLALTDADANARREEADRACRARYSEDVVGPALEQAILG